jgi:ATP-binding cassette, subfamily B, bacterial MsbA
MRERLARLWPYFKGGRVAAMWIVVASLVGASTEPMIPALLQGLLDKGFAEQSVPLWMVPVALLGVFGLRGAAGFAAQYLLSYVANGAMLTLRQAMFRRLCVAELDLFHKQSASSLSNTLVYEVQNGTNMLVGALLVLTKDSMTLLALLGYLFYLNWQLTLIVLLVFPALVLVMRVLSKRLYGLTRRSQLATDDLAYVVEENVLAHRMIRLHAAQHAQEDRFAKLSHQLRGLALRSTVASAAMTPLTQMLAAMALSAVVAAALWQANASGTSVGSFVSFVTAMLMLVAPIKHLADVANPITRGLAALERGLELIENVAEQSSGQHSQGKARGQLDLSDVCVSYESQEGLALNKVSLHIEPGEVVALVGPSGAGKTTLVNLLPRFVEYSAGRIALDGVALPDWDLRSLRAQFALVSQDVVMLNDSLAANIALGQTVDRDRVNAAIQAANLGDMVAALPNGIDQAVGHNATQLSGGQRQRLAIARAIYKDAPILILDEATSALDNESERLVQEALHTLMVGRTTVVIAHRLSTIEHADRVLVMANGGIAEQGTHAELLSADGLYAKLHAQGATVALD